MSNRRKSVMERRTQAYRNAGNGPTVRTDGQGNIRRGQGRNNFPYGPAGHPSPSVLNLGSNTEDTYGRARLRGSQRIEDLNAETRDSLRAMAKKAGVAGYGKMTKAQLVSELVFR